MARANTECTELSVGFGLLNIEPTTANLRSSELETKFEGTLSQTKYHNFVEEFARRNTYYRQFWRIGVDLRNTYAPFANLSSVRWEGSTQQASRVSMAIDLRAANTAISVKANSNVVSNLSLHTLFISLPKGGPSFSRSDNWYNTVAPTEYQSLYLYARDRWAPEFPDKVEDYLAKIKGKENRQRLGRAIASLSKSEVEEFNELYIQMCYKVAQESAAMFNKSLEESVNSGIRGSVIEGIVKQVFRIGDTAYILCGLDKNQEFAVQIPDLTSWKRQWQVKSIQAIPDNSAGQSVVRFSLLIERKKPRFNCEVNFHVEIRWSHKKLNGSPEGKFYKDFQWTDVPFFERVYDFDEVVKGRCIGAGGFGQVFEVTLRGSSETYAMKELNIQSGDEDARKRFELELTLQSSLQHPNIMPIIRSNLSSKAPWFLMPLAEMNLSDQKDLTNNLFQVNRIYCEVLNGISYAHENGVIHRDIKPDNILFDDQNSVLISDFGLGKRPGDSLQLTNSSNNSMGTFAYAAPEQLSSFKDADHRADIFSLGKLLYFLLTQEEPHSMDLDCVSEPYRAIILKCTKNEPALRYQTVAELLSDFEMRTSSSQQ